MKNNLHDSTPILRVLQQLKEGSLNPETLDDSTRDELVSLLVFEGWTYEQIGQLLNCSTKTVQRSMKSIRQKNQVKLSPDFAGEMAGDLVRTAQQHWAALMRIARSANASASEKTNAELQAWQVKLTLNAELRNQGYLPSAAREVIGRFSHTVNKEEKGIEELKKMVIDIECAALDTATMTPELADEIKKLNGKIERAELVQEVESLSQKQQEVQNKEDIHE
ncbi:MAG TPA: ECF-type sigma factor [Candidatus Omnitrophota bacterium]|nr:ECF-type sigma factor [Candidatus Omnitrophota bacterium]